MSCFSVDLLPHKGWFFSLCAKYVWSKAAFYKWHKVVIFCKGFWSTKSEILKTTWHLPNYLKKCFKGLIFCKKLYEFLRNTKIDWYHIKTDVIKGFCTLTPISLHFLCRLWQLFPSRKLPYKKGFEFRLSIHINSQIWNSTIIHNSVNLSKWKRIKNYFFD